MIKRIKIFLLIFVTLLVASSSGQTVFAMNGVYDKEFYEQNDIVFYEPGEDELVVEPILNSSCLNIGVGDTTKLYNPGDNNLVKIWNYFTAIGLTCEQSAGIMGNLQQEAHFDPMVTNSYGTYGIGQWMNYNEIPGGRRDQLVKHVYTDRFPELMSYYTSIAEWGDDNASESTKYRATSNITHAIMDEDPNDKILLAELEFLVDESKNRLVSSEAASRVPGISTSDTEWGAITKQKTTNGDVYSTIKRVSDIWLFSFERPGGDGNAESAKRANFGNEIYDENANTVSAGLANGTKKELAAKIIEGKSSGKISFGFNAKGYLPLIQDVADGINDGGSVPCGVNVNVLRLISDLNDSKGVKSFRITSVNRLCDIGSWDVSTSTTDWHKYGNGSSVDIDILNGDSAWKSPQADIIIKTASKYAVGSSNLQVGQSDCGGYSKSKLPTANYFLGDSCNHLHVGVKPETDPNLEYLVTGMSHGDPARDTAQHKIYLKGVYTGFKFDMSTFTRVQG